MAGMPASEMVLLIGQEAELLAGAGSISIPVVITDVRELFGRIDLQIRPKVGYGEAWIGINRLNLKPRPHM